MNTKLIKKEVRCAINKFKKFDWNYLSNKNVYEVTLSHRIAVYLENKFDGYSVDCEYNKSVNDYKIILKRIKIRPDIIIHKRGTSENLCIIEIKKASKSSKKGKNEIERIKNIIKTTELNYKIGIFIGILKNKIDICWIIKNNEKINVDCESL